jgi:mono/diheme cytochrome c family protein
LKRALLVALCSVVAVAVVWTSGRVPAGGAEAAKREGDPTHGGLVWATNGCGACHAFARAGSSGAAGGAAPNLDRWLVPDARRVKLSTELLVFRRVYWGGRGMPAYGTTLSAQDLDDLVSFVAGKPFTAPPGQPVPLPPLPSPPPLVTASPAAVARWVKVMRLPPKAAKGAALFARVGCLSCHTYLGSGKRRRGAPDLGTIGRSGRSAASFAGYVATPYRSGNTLMPTYADLSAGDLGRIGAFLAASKGPKKP